MKIVEWNIGLNKKYGEIISKICEEKADIYVLTEVKEDFDVRNEQLIQMYQVCGDIGKGKGCNNVLMLVNVDNQKKTKILAQSREGRDAPDYLVMKVGKLSIMGVRFRNHIGDMVAEEKYERLENQQNAFWSLLLKYKPDVIIGDFNVNSALTYKDASWSKFRHCIQNKHKYRFYDASIENYTFSYQRCLAKRKSHIGTCTDHFFVNSEKGLIINSIQYQWGPLELEHSRWPSDHAMLIVDIKEIV